jgi:hypothetical protein
LRVAAPRDPAASWASGYVQVMAVQLGGERRSRRPNLLFADAASIAAGISLVESGLAASVTLVGFRFGERLLPEAIAQAQAAGVTLTPSREGAGAMAIEIRRAAG